MLCKHASVISKMKFSVLLVVLVVFVLSDVNGKRTSGSSRRGGSSGGGFSWFGSRSKPKPPEHRPSAPTSFHQHESSYNSRPSAPSPAITRSSIPPVNSYPTHSYPTHSSSPSHTGGFGNDPYSRQPPSNPHYGGHQNIPSPPNGISVPTIHNSHTPYPANLPNHPHPMTGPSHYPSNGAISPQHYPSVHGGIPPPSYNSPSYGSPSYGSGSYHPSNPHPSYHPPPAYHPPSTPFIPGQPTHYVIAHAPSSGSSGGSGIGTAIAQGAAAGVAGGVTNAITNRVIDSIFRPSSGSSHVHTYPSAPAPGTPTTVINNYYNGQSGPNDNPSNGNNNNNNNNNAPSNVNGPVDSQGQQSNVNQGPSVAQNNQGLSSSPSTDGKGNPSTSTNGVVSRTGESQPENPTSNYLISDENIMKLTEELFDKQENNLNQYVELNLQKRLTNPEQGKTDEAQEPLFKLKPELDSIPTVTALRALYNNYNRDGNQKEDMSLERRNKDRAFLDEVIKTPVMSRALDWLAENKFIESYDEEKRELLKRMWFSVFEEKSSGFERIFLSEKFGDSGVVGMQNWLYFAHLESQNKVNYLSYADTKSLSGKGSLLKLNYETEGFTIQNATIFVGTAPELEMALYTVCFFARPDGFCPVSLGGAKFYIYTHPFRYFGKDLIDLGFPAI